jgi:hypothetical protein
MDGRLACHAAFVACIAAALYRCGTDPVRLAADRTTLTLMCQAITAAFVALRTSGTAGLPRNLAVLHNPILRPVAVATGHGPCAPRWASCALPRTAGTPEAEMRALAHDVAARITGSLALTELLRPLNRRRDRPGHRPASCHRTGRWE